MHVITKIFLVILLLGSSSVVKGADVVVAISPHQASNELKQQYSMLNHYVLSLNPNTQVVLINGLSGKVIGTYHAPIEAKYQHPKVKKKLNAAFFKGYASFMKQQLSNQKLRPNYASSIDIPHVLQETVDLYKSDKPLHIIMLGSAMYDNGKDRSYSMVGGAIPSDAYLLESRKDNPFGTVGRESMLEGVTVSFGWPQGMPIFHDQHLFYLERFWALYIQQQSGHVGVMTQSIKELMSSRRSHQSRNQQRYELDKEAKKEMIQLRPQKAVKKLPPSAQLKAKIINQPDSLLNDVEVSLSWDCACDIDLYARHNAQAEWIYFGNSQTSEGHHWKDVQSANKLSHAHETISFQLPVSLKHLVLAANFYSGSAPNGVFGEIKIVIAGQVYTQSFHIPAEQGSRMPSQLLAKLKGDNTQEHVVFINPLNVIKGS